MSALLLIGLGIAAGALSGMGIGGGVILIPALGMFFGLSQHAAQGINLVYFIPTALIAVIIHKKGGRIEKTGLLGIIIWGIIGSVAGALIALKLDPQTLRYIFAGFLLIMGVFEFFKKSK
ncbi:MAG: sulfite exporter TauE/SafE family protein [Defluviitaleaceae bacterium]|nr:sulfite exporter TauE/SafE family protein [Defluviitaleaceae bacterium]